MKGAKEYVDIIYPNQYGQLYIEFDRTTYENKIIMNIYVVPHGLDTKKFNLFDNCKQQTVKVYGLTSLSKNCCGWLHYGKWVEDFKTLVSQARYAFTIMKEKEKRQKVIMRLKEMTKSIDAKERVSKILKDY